MSLTIEIIPDPGQGGFTARLPNIPAYGEGETENEAIDDFKESLHGYVRLLARKTDPAALLTLRDDRSRPRSTNLLAYHLST